nr:hypothetical protein GCM10020092_036290 [Actinoplanes digitatis]
MTGWTLGWALAPGQGVTQAWNAAVTVSGTAVTATNASYNGSVATGASVSFGFNGTWSGANPVPSSFTFNGTACAGGTAPSPTPCTGPSTPLATAAPAVKVWMAERLHDDEREHVPDRLGQPARRVLHRRRHRAEQRRRRPQHPDLAVRGQRHRHEERG